jgi:large subunit ribosomal protein L30
MTQILVTQKRSGIGQTGRQRATLHGLGLRRLNHTVTLRDTAAIRGMIVKVQHLIEVKVIEGEAPLSTKRKR